MWFSIVGNVPGSTSPGKIGQTLIKCTHYPFLKSEGNMLMKMLLKPQIQLSNPKICLIDSECCRTKVVDLGTCPTWKNHIVWNISKIDTPEDRSWPVDDSLAQIHSLCWQSQGSICANCVTNCETEFFPFLSVFASSLRHPHCYWALWQQEIPHHSYQCIYDTRFSCWIL